MEQFLIGAFLVITQALSGGYTIPAAVHAAAPAVLTGTCTPGSSPRVTLQWQAVSGATTNALQKGDCYPNSSDFWCFVNIGESGSPPFSVYSYTDTNLQPDTVYQYRVKTDPGTASNVYTCDTTASTGPTVTKPSAGTLSPTTVTQTTATLRGSTNPNGAATQYWFEYGTGGSFDSQTASQSLSAGTSIVSVNAFASGLAATTQYSYRLVAENSAGQTVGNTVSFTTQSSGTTSNPACSDGADNDGDGKTDYPADPGCTSSSDTSETDTSSPPPSSAACSDNTDNDGDGKTDYPSDPGCSSASDNDEYNAAAAVPTLSVSPSSKSISIGETVLLKAYYDPDGSGSNPQQEVTGSVSWSSSNAGVVSHEGNAVFKGLAAGKSTVRAVYQGLTGESVVSVYTPAGRPLAKTTAASDISQAFAHLEGLANPNGASAQAWFEYGPTDALGTLTEKKSVGSGRSWQQVSIEVRLTPGTEYYYRLVVQSSVGTARGDTLKMSSAGNPTLELDPATKEIKTNETAAFKAYFDPDGSGPDPRRDVSNEATWLSSDTFVAFHERNGEFRARGPGEVIISALFNPSGKVTNIYDLDNLKAEGGVSVASLNGDGGFNLGGVTEEPEAPAAPASSSGLWSVIKWIFWLLLIAGIIIVIFVFARRKFREAEE